MSYCPNAGIVFTHALRCVDKWTGGRGDEQGVNILSVRYM